MHKPISWYDTPLGRLSGGEARRRAQPSVAEVVFEQTTRPRFDPNVTELVCALSLGAGRIPLIP
jgi:hypothetical protein